MCLESDDLFGDYWTFKNGGHTHYVIIYIIIIGIYC